MAGRQRWIRIVAAVALAAALSGCSGSSRTGDSAKLHDQAQAALARWDTALAAAGGPTSAFIPVDPLTGQIGDWEESLGSTGKIALGAGLFYTTVTLPSDTPPDGQIRWADGRGAAVPLMSAQDALDAIRVAGALFGPCNECTPLAITGASLTNVQLRTSRGLAQVPAWEFTISGSAVRATRVAVAARVTVPLPAFDENASHLGISIESATVSRDGRGLTVSFIGAPGPGSQACGADYTAEAVESAAAVVVIVYEHPHESLMGEACTAVGPERTADVTLASPLGNRTVLDVVNGSPVAVTQP